MSAKRLVILGAGESGTGTALLAKHMGYEVFVSDFGKISERYKAMLFAEGIEFEEGIHTEALILNATEVVKSPGIPDKAEIVKALRKLKIPVISEIEFASRYTKAFKIGITGTNGKTTTTMLIHYVLKSAGKNAILAGNIGESFAKAVLDEINNKEENRIYVLELSSFQLDGMFDTKLDIGILTNITPDHLDRYDYKIEKYVASKFRIAQNMNANDTFIYGIDNDLIENELIDFETEAQELPFSEFPDDMDGACGDEEGITIQIDNEEYFINLENAVLKGKHNINNMMAASLACVKLNVDVKTIEDAFATFINADHRMQDAGTIKGVNFINDSKATNIDSAWYALEAIKTPLIWIAGGVDKGNDYSLLNKVVLGKTKALICLTTDAEKLKTAFEGKIETITQVLSMQECVKEAFGLAKPGDTVLLSPCCASFDLFKNYEDRGQQFMNAVNTLKLEVDKNA